MFFRAAAMIADPPSDPEQTYNRLAKMQFATRVGSLANAGGVYASRDWSSFIPPEHFRGPSKTGSP